jgi:hypothetical protein
MSLDVTQRAKLARMGLVSPKGEDDGEDELQIQLSGELWLDGLENLDGREDEVRFDLADWPEVTRERLRERLDLFLVVSHWVDDTTLVVTEPLDPVYLERVLNQVKDQTQQGVDPSPGPSVEAPGGDVPIDEIGYDLDGWDEVNRSVLFAALDAEGIAFRIALPVDDPGGDEELIVAEADEARVDEIIDGIIEPDADDDRPAARPELLGELFVAADRLVRDPTEPGAHRALRDGVEAAGDGAPPFGVEKAWWQAVVRQAGELVERFGAHGVEHDEIAEQATSLRDLLRPYV